MAVRQTITYWPPTGDVSVPYGAPQQLEGRVCDRASDIDDIAIEFEKAIEIRGYIYLGNTTEPDPRWLLLQKAHEIVEVAKMPCLRTLTQRYVAFIN